jgi:hypothetical protein
MPNLPFKEQCMKNKKTNVGSFATAKLQAKRRSLLAIAIVAVIGVSFAACGGDDDDGGNDPNNPENPGGGGTLTVTGIPSEYNGKYAAYSSVADLPFLIGAQSLDVSTGLITAVQISNGSVNLPMWVAGNSGYTRFSGNRTVGNSNNTVLILNTATFSPSANNALTYKDFQSVTFSNGNASISWGNAGGNPNPGGGGDVLNGTWLRSSYYQIKIEGNNWVYSEGSMGEYSKGIWSSNSTISAPSTGTLTLTVTQIKSGNSWQDLPSEYNSVKTNTATYSLNASGNTLTISNAALTTSGVWGTLEGVYQKQ